MFLQTINEAIDARFKLGSQVSLGVAGRVVSYKADTKKGSKLLASLLQVH